MQTQILILIIMYVYRTLISALSIHIIHINLNMIFYTHNNLHKVLYRHTHTAMNLNVHDIGQYHTSYMLAHTHTHTDYGCSRNWVLILVGAKVLWVSEEWKVFNLALKDDRVKQCLRSCGSEFQMCGPKQEKVQKPWVLGLYCWIFSMQVSEEECNVQDRW